MINVNNFKFVKILILIYSMEWGWVFVEKISAGWYFLSDGFLGRYCWGGRGREGEGGGQWSEESDNKEYWESVLTPQKVFLVTNCQKVVKDKWKVWIMIIQQGLRGNTNVGSWLFYNKSFKCDFRLRGHISIKFIHTETNAFIFDTKCHLHSF